MVAEKQPTKLAAIEGWPTRPAAPRAPLLGWYTNGQTKFGISIPHGLSLLAYHRWSADHPRTRCSADQHGPPAENLIRIALQTTVGMGTLLAVLAVLYLFVRLRFKRLPESVWFYWAVVFAGPASVVALICGWVVTEVGRQPWVMYG